MKLEKHNPSSDLFFSILIAAEPLNTSLAAFPLSLERPLVNMNLESLFESSKLLISSFSETVVF